MTDKQALLDQIDRKITDYERRTQRARTEWEDEPTSERLEYYAQMRGKWFGLSEARKMIALIL